MCTAPLGVRGMPCGQAAKGRAWSKKSSHSLGEPSLSILHILIKTSNVWWFICRQWWIQEYDIPRVAVALFKGALKSKSFAHSARASGEQKSGYTEGPGQQNPWKSSPAAGKYLNNSCLALLRPVAQVLRVFGPPTSFLWRGWRPWWDAVTSSGWLDLAPKGGQPIRVATSISCIFQPQTCPFFQ